MELGADAGIAWVYYRTQALREVQLRRSPAGTLLPVADTVDGIVGPFPYSVVVLFDDAGLLDAEMNAAGLSLPD